MGDIKSKKLIIAKGLLFLFLGTFTSSVLLWLAKDWTIAVLLLIAIWSYCRFYYFAFYVIEKYVDSEFRFAGLASAFSYLLKRNH